MKISKLTTAAIFMFATLPPVSAERLPAGVPNVVSESIEQALTREVEKQTKQTYNLYQKTYQELTRAYNKKNFADPGHKTGWYRVDAFLKWLKENETKVEIDLTKTNLYSIWNKDLHQAAMWAFLGVHYVADQYGLFIDYSKLKFSAAQEDMFDKVTGEININPKKNRPILFSTNDILNYINAGIHEGTHALPYLMSGNKKVEPLSEMATFYSSHLYALPVKETADQTFNGIRDSVLLTQKYAFDYTRWEYHQFMLGPLFLSQLKKQDILSLKNNSDPKFWTAVLNYIYAANNRYFIEKPGRNPEKWNSCNLMEDELLSSGLLTQKELGAMSILFNSSGAPSMLYIGKHDLTKIPKAHLTGSSHLFISRLPLKAGGYFYNIQGDYIPLNKEEYLKRLYYPLEITQPVRDFYNSMEKSIPQNIKEPLIKEVITGINENMYYGSGKISFLFMFFTQLEPYLNKGLTNAMNKSGMRPVPVPKGYF